MPHFTYVSGAMFDAAGPREATLIARFYLMIASDVIEYSEDVESEAHFKGSLHPPDAGESHIAQEVANGRLVAASFRFRSMHTVTALAFAARATVDIPGVCAAHGGEKSTP